MFMNTTEKNDRRELFVETLVWKKVLWFGYYFLNVFIGCFPFFLLGLGLFVMFRVIGLFGVRVIC